MSREDKSSPEGLWDALTSMEVSSTLRLSESLKPFEAPLRSCYEAGVQAPTLKAKRHQEPDILYAALFLKRALNDLRGVWILTQTGYTAQAASIAAALFENALAATCLAGSPANASKLQASKSGDLPWGAKALSKMVARRWQDQARQEDKPSNEREYEKNWRQAYLGYKWLCKIKHPTLRSAIYDAPATSVRSDEYVVMAAPDIRDEDLAVKAQVLMISISRVYEAIRQFARALECDKGQHYYDEFIDRLQTAHSGALEAYDDIVQSPLPFDVRDTKLVRDWATLSHERASE
jgi:hypothetical protein